MRLINNGRMSVRMVLSRSPTECSVHLFDPFGTHYLRRAAALRPPKHKGTPMTLIADHRREAPIFTCEACGDRMTHLGDLPDAGRFPAVRVFRCYECNKVVTERWQLAPDERTQDSATPPHIEGRKN